MFKFKKTRALAVSAACLALPLAAQIPQSMLRLPDTGQTQSFTNTTGEDADYAINPPVFIQNGDGTVTDTITGLMWQQTDGGEMTIENAAIYCEDLQLAGYDNWRLPTAREAFSILNHGKSNPALDAAVFTTTGAEYWWTSEHDATNANKIWVTNRGGGIGNHLKTETISAGGVKKMHVRAVRDQQTPPTVDSHFTDNGDGTVTDLITHLIWQKMPAPDTISWESALVFAENLDLAGSSDWRLPNIKELQSLSDAGLANPSVDAVFFPQIGVKRYWSSTSLPNQTTRAWYLDTRFGITTYAEKTGNLSVICVRGGESGSVKINDPLAGAARGIEVFPNPFSNFIYFKNRPENAVFELTNALGQQVFLGENISTVDFSYLPVGFYNLKISGKGAAVTRLIKI